MKLYSFTPTEEMTTYELAVIMRALFVSLIEGIQGQPTRGADDLEIDDLIYDHLPEDLKQFFIKKETVIQSPSSKPGQSEPVDKF